PSSGQNKSLRQADSAQKILESGIRAKRIEIRVVFQGEHLESSVVIALFQLLKSVVLLAKVSIRNRQAELCWSCHCGKAVRPYLFPSKRIGARLLELLYLLPVHFPGSASAVSSSQSHDSEA